MRVLLPSGCLEHRWVELKTLPKFIAHSRKKQYTGEYDDIVHALHSWTLYIDRSVEVATRLLPENNN